MTPRLCSVPDMKARRLRFIASRDERMQSLVGHCDGTAFAGCTGFQAMIELVMIDRHGVAIFSL